MLNAKTLRFLPKKELVKMIISMDKELSVLRVNKTTASSKPGSKIINNLTVTGRLPERLMTQAEKEYYLAGRALEAVKSIKDRTGLSLFEAKAIMDEWVKYNPNTIARNSPSPAIAYPTANRLNMAEINFVRNGQKLQAVKSIKDRTGLGLKESKQMVDAYVERNPGEPTRYF